MKDVVYTRQALYFSYLCPRNINDPYGEADRMNKVNKEMVNDKIVNNMMFNFTHPHVANGHYLESIKIIATRK